MKNITKIFFKGTISALIINGMLTTSVVADQWQTRAEQKTAISQPTTVPASQSVKQAATIDNSFLKHTAETDVVAGERLQIKTKIRGKDGVKLARVYFKTAAASKYSFVVLNKGNRNIYTAELPAAINSVSSIEYKIVVQNAFGEIYKTDKYTVAVTPAEQMAQQSSDAGFIDVYSEYPEDDTDTVGFSDKVRYTYGATKLATSLGQALSVANSGSGYVGASGSAGSASASGTAATTAGATTSTASLGTVAAVGAGSVGVAAATSASGIEGNDTGAGVHSFGGGECFTGFVEFNTTGFETETDTVTYTSEWRDGLPYSISGRSSVGGCWDTGDVITSEWSDTVIQEYGCITEEFVNIAVLESIEGDTIKVVQGHISCPVIFVN